MRIIILISALLFFVRCDCGNSSSNNQSKTVYTSTDEMMSMTIHEFKGYSYVYIFKDLERNNICYVWGGEALDCINMNKSGTEVGNPMIGTSVGAENPEIKIKLKQLEDKIKQLEEKDNY